MKTLIKNIGKEKLITNLKGDVEYVMVPVETYNKLIELIEDEGLAIAMKQSINDKIYLKDDAVKYLSGDET